MCYNTVAPEAIAQARQGVVKSYDNYEIRFTVCAHILRRAVVNKNTCQTVDKPV